MRLPALRRRPKPPPADTRCAALTVKGQRCRLEVSAPGATRCVFHQPHQDDGQIHD